MKFKFWIILSIVLFANSGFRISTTLHFEQHLFALAIIANPSGADPLVSYAIVTMTGNKLINSKPISRDAFIRMACGDWPCKANPGREDLFLKNDLEVCGRYVDTMTRKKVYLCDPLDSLWKVRFSEHPYIFDDGGWSQGKITPCQKQSEYLYQEYNVGHINVDYFIGNFMWKLLRDVQNPEWIMNYSALEDI